jgi:excisionase family DNA binding protein
MHSPFVLIDEQSLRKMLREELMAHRSASLDRRAATAHINELPDGAKEFLTNREAQQYLGLSRMTLQRYRDDGTLPYSRVGNNVYYKRADVIALLENNSVHKSPK